MRKATNIMWDYDEEEMGGTAQFLGLPDYVDIPDGIADEDIADYLSDRYEFLVYGFNIERR